MIFSLLANSRARSKGILKQDSVSPDAWKSSNSEIVPDALQMHGPNLNDVSDLLTLQNTITATSRHSCDVQELCAVDHMIVCEYTLA